MNLRSMHPSILNLKWHHITNLSLKLCNGWQNWDVLTLPLRCLCFHITNTYPRKGHFVDSLCIIYYLKGMHNSCLNLDLTYSEIVYENFGTEKIWPEYYGDIKETIPLNSPTSLGKSIDLWVMVNSEKKRRQDHQALLYCLYYICEHGFEYLAFEETSDCGISSVWS